MMLAEFIRDEIIKPFEWGKTDCASTADRWVCLSAGVSPLSKYGRVHKNEIDANGWLNEAGGFAVAVNRVMRASGFKKTKEPANGDIGLISYNGMVMMAIKTDHGWFSRSENGIMMVQTDKIKAWKIQCRKH